MPRPGFAERWPPRDACKSSRARGVRPPRFPLAGRGEWRFAPASSRSMKNQRIMLAFLVGWSFSLLTAVAADLKLAWETNLHSLALASGGQVVWRFNYATTNATKPFFHPLALPGHAPLTWQNPADHVWHYGLWFSWKYLNGVNYWEENKQTRQSDGLTAWRVIKVEPRTDFSARIELELEYRPRQATNVALSERRVINVSSPGPDGAYALDWRLDFQAGNAPVKLDRTPLPGEPGGQVYGGYAGLSLRFARDFTNTQIRATSDPGEPKDNRYRFSARGADYSGQIGAEQFGIAMLDHPANPRHPSRWYAIVNPKEPFAFFNAAWLQLGPQEIGPGEKFSLQYRVIVHPGRWEASRLQSEHDRFRQATR
jgi:hypothetical protein